jgi:glyoxylase I family protein
MDLERSRTFYRDVLGLKEIARPNFAYAGIWFEFGNGCQLHIVVRADATFRGKPIEAFDVHFAVRVASYTRTVEELHAKGYREDAAADNPAKMILRPDSITGNPQIYILDPDQNIVEFNCESL